MKTSWDEVYLDMTTNLELGEAIADKLGGYVAKTGVPRAQLSRRTHLTRDKEADICFTTYYLMRGSQKTSPFPKGSTR